MILRNFRLGFFYEMFLTNYFPDMTPDVKVSPPKVVTHQKVAIKSLLLENPESKRLAKWP